MQVGYDALVTLCQSRGVSLAEVGSLTTLVLGFFVFDLFVTLAEDDTFEAISFFFCSTIVAALALLVLAVDIQYYYMLSAVSGGEATLRVFYADIVNNGLCLLRIFFCWVRYLFYDLQAELVDFAFHYTETGDEGALEAAGWGELDGGDAGLSLALLTAEVGALVGLLLDLGFVLIQLLIGLGKLTLALFLFWLILDLFLLRAFARTETLGWGSARAYRAAK
jgi:hypothetical protein